MDIAVAAPWKVKNELIEQPSWGGEYIAALKGLAKDPLWKGRKIGQSYELANSSQLVSIITGAECSWAELLSEYPEQILGPDFFKQYGGRVSLLIKLTQAKGNSFQVHLPEGKTLGSWVAKPEAWFYLAPGLCTFGMKTEKSFEQFSSCLLTIDQEMHRMTESIRCGELSLAVARENAQRMIAELQPYSYVNTVKTETDDIVDLTPGGIHHSWEQDDQLCPEGNLVYEVQLDVPDSKCSMRGFDKGKILDDGSLRDTHVKDYLKTVERDSFHNDFTQHTGKPYVIEKAGTNLTEAIFRTQYFWMDRITVRKGCIYDQPDNGRFHHLFVLNGDGMLKHAQIKRGQSYIMPAIAEEYELKAQDEDLVILKTYLPPS